MADQKHDRTTQDVGNIVALEHVNVKVPDDFLRNFTRIFAPLLSNNGRNSGRTTVNRIAREPMATISTRAG